MHWNKGKDKETLFIKCKGGPEDWVSCSSIKLDGYGMLKANDIINKFLKGKHYHPESNPHFSVRFE